MNKKPFLKRYRHLSELAAVVILACCLAFLGAPMIICVAFVATYQLMQFAMSKRPGVCFTTALTSDQIKEFEKLCGELKELATHIPGIKELSGADGGFSAIKKLPELLKAEQKRADQLDGEMKKLQKQLLRMQGSQGVRYVGNKAFVTDDCARAFAGLFMIQCHNKGIWPRMLGDKETAINLAADWLGIEAKAALSGAEIPLPTVYIPQVIELVFAYGCARQYGTVFPLGAGTVKLPRLAAGEDDFGYLGVGTAGMGQAVGENKVAAELVTFTANKFGGLIRIPTEIEEDTFIPLGQFLARYIARQLAKMEDKTFFLGDGTAAYANIIGIGKYCQTNNAYLLALAAGKTAPSDATLDDFRTLRSKVSAAVLANMAANGQTSAAYYLHPTWEPVLRGFNKYPNFIVFTNEGGKPMLDGWPVRWIGVGQAFSKDAAPSTPIAYFGDLSYWYLGERGSTRVEVSKEVYFATDELAMRALERIDVEAMAVDAMATLQTGAAA